MNKSLVAACIQTNAGPEIAANLDYLAEAIKEARRRGAELIALPENVSMMVKGRDKLFARAKSESEHPAVPFFCRVAKETGAWIIGGSLAIIFGDGRLANRCYIFNPQGEIAGYYDKIHMFDADVGGNETYHESASFHPGDRAVVVDTPWGKIGLTICYDMRFPHLYRALAKAGASIIAVPAAFTVPTGQAHWHVLLRARAIETGAFILAPAQCGEHDGNRKTFGHSLIIDPWGKILAESGDKTGVIVAELDLNKVSESRRMLPSLQHDRPFEKPN